LANALLPGFWDTDLAKLPAWLCTKYKDLCSSPRAQRQLALPQVPNVPRECHEETMTGGKLRDAGTEVALGGGELGAAVQRVVHDLYIVYIQDQKKSQGPKHMRICSPSVPRLKHEWNHTVGLIINLRCEPLFGLLETSAKTLGNENENGPEGCAAGPF